MSGRGSGRGGDIGRRDDGVRPYDCPLPAARPRSYPGAVHYWWINGEPDTADGAPAAPCARVEVRV
ncbi:hypothetical protein GCM10027072_49030 [Streptomyces bullii]